MIHKVESIISTFFLVLVGWGFISCKPEAIRNMTGTKQKSEKKSDFQGANAGSNLEPMIRRFKVSEERAGQIEFNPKDGALSAEIELEDNFAPNSLILKQEPNVNVVDILQQGNPEIQRNEKFKQDELGIIDIQIVIDNSGSMQQEQDRIKNSLKDLLNFISTTNWQINITTTDPGSGSAADCSRGLIRKGETNASVAFQNALDAGVMGSPGERGVLMAVEGLKCHNNQWLRKNASTAVLFISDEDNCSNGNDQECEGKPYQSTKYLLDYLTGTMGKNVGVDARVYGIFWVPGTTCTEALNQGFAYQSLVNTSKGKSGSICDADYATVLQSISKDLNSILTYEFILKSIPLAGSLKVFVTQGDTTSEITNFIVNEKYLRFLAPPPADSTISAQYQVANPLPLTNRFKTTQKPKVETLKVRVDGVEIASADFSFDSASQEVVLNTAPKPDAEIRIDYSKDIQLLDKFVIAKKVKKDSLKITLNNVPTTDFSLVESDGKTSVAFPKLPEPETAIAVTFLEATGPRLVYPLDLSGDGIKLVSILDSDLKSLDVNVDLAARKITFPEAEFKSGRKVILKFQPKSFGNTKFNFPEKINPESYKLAFSQGTCSFQLAAESVDISCLPTSDAPIVALWSYRTAVQQSFTLPEVVDPNAGGWQVLVNQKEISDFKRQERTITINQPLSQNDEVQITYFSKL